MPNTLIDAYARIPQKYKDMLSADDLTAIEDGNFDRMSTRGLRVLDIGSKDLGAGEYLDVGTSMAGALGGAALGSAILPGIGTAVGGVIGGALGAFGGEVAEDVIASRDVDVGFGQGGAGRAAAESALWDGIFMGSGTVVRKIAGAMGINPGSLLNSVTGIGKQPQTRKYIDFPEGTEDSIRQIQEILHESGGGLTVSQTGKAGVARTFLEQIANIGTFSSSMMAKRIEENIDIFRQGFRAMMDGIDPSLARTSSDLGEAIVGTIEAGEKIVKSYYGAGMDALIEKAGGMKVDTTLISKAIDDIFKNAKTDIEVFLTEGAQKVLGERASVLAGASIIIDPATKNPFRYAKIADLDSIIKYQQSLTKRIEAKRPSITNINSDEVAYRELSAAEKKIKDAISATIARLGDSGKDLASEYKALNKFYGESINALYPESIGNNIIQAGNREAYSSLGNIISNAGDIGKIRGIMKSIDTAFAAAKKAGVEISGEINTPERAKGLLRQSFLLNKLTDVSTHGLDIKRLERIASDLKNDSVKQKYVAILGESYPQFKTFIDGAVLSSKKPGTGLFSLSIRGREVGAAVQAASFGQTLFGATAGAAASAAGLGVAGATLAPLSIFAIPVVAAKVALNREATQRLLGLNKIVSANPSIGVEVVGAQVAKILNALSEDDMEDIRLAIAGVRDF